MTRGLQAAIVAAALVAAAGLGFWLYHAVSGDPGKGRAQIGGPFTLSDGDGGRVSWKDLRGRHHLIYFGYTYCPDICPTTLQTATEALDRLPPRQAERVRLVFITVDPERDDAEAVKTYASHFFPGTLGLTGTPEEIAQAAKAFRIYYRKAPQEDGDYLVDHSSVLFLMDGKGEYLTHFTHRSTPDEIAAALKRTL